MKKLFLAFFLLIYVTQFTAQIRDLDRGLGSFGGNPQQIDSLDNDEIAVKLSGKTTYTDYKVISYKNDTTHIDTTLTIKKEYKFNFRRKDNFELLPFHNQGQTFNRLGYDFSRISLFPDIGFKAKQFNFEEVEDINYYEVPTPTTEAMYRTGQEQGQVIDVLFTTNFNRRLNVSLSYKGLRSLGHYRRSLASSGNFKATLSYQTPKNQYGIRLHIAKQDFTNQESGGLPKESLKRFIKNEKDFRDRPRLDVNLNDAENTLKSIRIYLDHNYKLFSSKDSTNTKDFSNLEIGQEFYYQEKEYLFHQAKVTTKFFGDAYSSENISESTPYEITNNQVYLAFNSKYVLGRFKVNANYTNISYGYEKLLNLNAAVPVIKLRGKAASFGASWRGKIGNFQVNADATTIPGSGHLAGNYFNGEALYKKDSVFTVKGGLTLSSKAPNFNYQLFQSAYNEYNWKNNFTNIGTRNLEFSFLSKWGNATADFTNIQDYVYFDENNKPQQFKGALTYLKIKANKEFKFWKFALDNTVMYQKVANGMNVLKVPELVTRNTFYYTDDWFKGKPLLVQIGVTFKYFTQYKANAYNPLLSEFTLQNKTKIGYPVLDAFLNFRVRRTRIYFKFDNVLSTWSAKNYYAAPDYPYRDMSIRFGLVWNWFI